MSVPWSTAEGRVDAALGLVCAVVSLASVLTVDPTVTYDYPPPNAALVVLACVASIPLALRRTAPMAVLVTCLGAVSTIMVLRWNEGLTPLCLLVALYSVAVHRTTRVALAALLLVLGAFAGFGLIGAPFFDSPAAILSSAIFCVPWGLGLAVRHQSNLRRAALDQALAAERELVTATERAAHAERLRIARELHDVVAHTLSVIAVESGVAGHLTATQPERAAPALGRIEQASRAALDDLRRMLGALREEGSDPAEDQPTAPTPGLPELRALIASHSSLHGSVSSTIEPSVESAPESIRLAVFRIVQEGLTNVRKHSPGATAAVRVTLTGLGVEVEVTNGPAQVAPVSVDPGWGLIGVRERVSLFGGTCEAGPTSHGGYRLRAVVPTLVPVSGATA